MSPPTVLSSEQFLAKNICLFETSEKKNSDMLNSKYVDCPVTKKNISTQRWDGPDSSTSESWPRWTRSPKEGPSVPRKSACHVERRRGARPNIYRTCKAKPLYNTLDWDDNKAKRRKRGVLPSPEYSDSSGLTLLSISELTEWRGKHRSLQTIPAIDPVVDFSSGAIWSWNFLSLFLASDAQSIVYHSSCWNFREFLRVLGSLSFNSSLI